MTVCKMTEDCYQTRMHLIPTWFPLLVRYLNWWRETMKGAPAPLYTHFEQLRCKAEHTVSSSHQTWTIMCSMDGISDVYWMPRSNRPLCMSCAQSNTAFETYWLWWARALQAPQSFYFLHTRLDKIISTENCQRILNNQKPKFTLKGTAI